MHQNQTSELRQVAFQFSETNGAGLSADVENQSELLMHWVSYLSKYQLTGVANQLLEASGSAIRETAGSLSMGLLRSALFSLRAEIDLVISWIYFKDHPIEWGYVNRTAEGFKLKSEILQHIGVHYEGFNRRYGLLVQIKKRQEIDPYRLLSAHIHGQSEPVLPVVNDLKDLVQDKVRCQQCAQVAFEVSEYLSDILLSMYSTNWMALPERIRTLTLPRFVSPEQRTEFFK